MVDTNHGTLVTCSIDFKEKKLLGHIQSATVRFRGKIVASDFLILQSFLRFRVPSTTNALTFVIKLNNISEIASDIDVEHLLTSIDGLVEFLCLVSEDWLSMPSPFHLQNKMKPKATGKIRCSREQTLS